MRFFSRQNTVDARREVVNCEFCVPVDGMYKSDPKGSICPKVRFENSAYGQGLSLGTEFVFKLEVGPGRKIPPRRLFGNDPLWAVRIGYCRDGYNLRSM